MARDGEVKQRQHFCNHGDTICHPKSGYVTIKLHGTSTCRCNNNAIFSERAFSSFLPSTYVAHVKRSLGSSRQTAKMAALLNSLLFVLKQFVYA